VVGRIVHVVGRKVFCLKYPGLIFETHFHLIYCFCKRERERDLQVCIRALVCSDHISCIPLRKSWKHYSLAVHRKLRYAFHNWPCQDGTLQVWVSDWLPHHLPLHEPTTQIDASNGMDCTFGLKMHSLEAYINPSLPGL
jgi:hypothetical protein